MSITDFSTPVRKSLMGRELLAGIPASGMLLLFIFGTLTIYMAQIKPFWIVVAVLYIAGRLLTKKDEFLIDIVLYSLSYKDVYIP